MKIKGLRIFDLGSIPVDRTKQTSTPCVGAFLFGMIPTIRQELRVGAASGSEHFALRDKKQRNARQAKQTIGNRLAGRAAKGAIPVDRTIKIGRPSGVLFLFYRVLTELALAPLF